MSGNVLSDSLAIHAVTKADSVRVMKKWGKAVDEKSLKPYIKSNFENFLTVRGPSEVYQKLSNAQDKENIDKVHKATNAFNLSLFVGAGLFVVGSKLKNTILSKIAYVIGGIAVASGLVNLIYKFTSQRNDVSNDQFIPKPMDGI